MLLFIQDVSDVLHSMKCRSPRVVIYDFACGLVKKLIKDKSPLIDATSRGLLVTDGSMFTTNDDEVFVTGQVSFPAFSQQEDDEFDSKR